MKKQQTGFTLIELVMVIVILGILAATALPKFVNLSGNANKSVLEGVEGSMRAANTMIYAVAAQTAGALGAGPTNVTVGGATVSVVYGYAADATNLSKAMDLSPLTNFTVGTTTIQLANATTPASCQVTYTAATSTATPTYNEANTGC